MWLNSKVGLGKSYAKFLTQFVEMWNRNRFYMELLKIDIIHCRSTKNVLNKKDQNVYKNIPFGLNLKSYFYQIVRPMLLVFYMNLTGSSPET